MKAFLYTIKNTCNYASRSTRTEFWLFSFLAPVFILAIAAIEAFVFKQASDMSRNDSIRYMMNSLSINLLSFLAILPLIALYVRRLHDLDKSGWQLLIYLIPLLGPLYISIITSFYRGTEGRNRFGGDPRVIRNY